MSAWQFDGDDTGTTRHRTWWACSSSSGMLVWCWLSPFSDAWPLPLLTDWSWGNEAAVYWYLWKGRVFLHRDLLWMLWWTVLLVFLRHATSWLKVKLSPLRVLLESRLRIGPFKRGEMGSHRGGGVSVLPAFFIFTLTASCWMTVGVSDDTLIMTLKVT